MRGVGDFPRVLMFNGYIDFRKRRRSLSAYVQAVLNEDPFSNTLFVFLNKGRDCIRLLHWDKNGFAMWEKELEEGKFPFPKCRSNEALEVTAAQLTWLMAGVDIWSGKLHRELKYSRLV
jgi:transposase